MVVVSCLTGIPPPKRPVSPPTPWGPQPQTPNPKRHRGHDATAVLVCMHTVAHIATRSTYSSRWWWCVVVSCRLQQALTLNPRLVGPLFSSAAGFETRTNRLLVVYCPATTDRVVHCLPCYSVLYSRNARRHPEVVR